MYIYTYIGNFKKAKPNQQKTERCFKDSLPFACLVFHISSVGNIYIVEKLYLEMESSLLIKQMLVNKDKLIKHKNNNKIY